jgi:Fe-S-cluster containining protein
VSGEKHSPLSQDPRAQLQERILADSPRLGPGDRFKFACRPGISCFTRCCSDVNIFLCPYDVLRMKRRLGMASGDFLRKYAILPICKDMKIPVVMLRMNDDEGKTCPFVTEGGCSIYADRPWPCRMYPLGLAAQKDATDEPAGDRFYFLLHEAVCQGFDEPREWTVRQWLDDQRADEYDAWGEPFKELTLHEYFEKGGSLSAEKMHMLFTACYDLDTFRQFVLESTLLQRFEVDENLVEELRYDDEGLLRFAFLWLRFSLFGERTMKLKPDVFTAAKAKLGAKKFLGREAAEGSAVET